MIKNNKTKTLYSLNKNVDISSLVKKDKNVKVKKDIKDKTNKSKTDNDDDSLNDSEFSLSDSDNESDNLESDEIDDNNIDDNIIGDKNISDKDNEDNDILSDKDDESEISNDESYDEKEDDEKEYINNDELLKTNCYSRYAKIDYDDLDFDELFGDDHFNPIYDVKLTKPILTKYEFVRLLTDRTKQLAQGAKPMLKNIEGLSSKEIAKLELKNKIIPLIIERPVPNSGVERWKLSELEVPEYFF